MYIQLDSISTVSLLPVRDQGELGTCLAFATSSAHEHFQGVEEYLSPAYLYGLACNTDPLLNGHNGLTIKAVENVISNEGQVHEDKLPYDGWIASQNFPNATHMPREIHFSSSLETIFPDFDHICEYLEKGVPVILGIEITEAFVKVDGHGYIDEPGGRELGNHAIVAVGCDQNEYSQKFLVIRNSWGMAWGQKGHAFVSQIYIENRLHFAAILKNGEN